VPSFNSCFNEISLKDFGELYNVSKLSTLIIRTIEVLHSSCLNEPVVNHLR